jgi:hypothetical protein
MVQVYYCLDQNNSHYYRINYLEICFCTFKPEARGFHYNI